MEERRRHAAAAQQQDPPSSPDGGASSASPLHPPAGDPTAPVPSVTVQAAEDAPYPVMDQSREAVLDAPQGNTAPAAGPPSGGLGPSQYVDLGPEHVNLDRDALKPPPQPEGAGGSPALPYEVAMPMGDPAKALRTWALALLPPRLRKCADKTEAAIVLDINDQRIRAYTKGLSDEHYKAYQADLDAIIARLP